MLTAILTILLFLILITPHEFGHFIVAKLCGVQVNEFAIGMGPAIWQKQKGETLYSIRAIPLGGYNAMEGENEESDNPRAFNNKSVPQKLAVLFAGAGMNVIVAIILLSFSISASGIVMQPLELVREGSPAEAAGLQAGDTITAINGTPTDSWSDVVTGIDGCEAGVPMEVEVRRGKETFTTTLVPEIGEDGRTVIGIQATISHSVLLGFRYGVPATWEMNKLMLESFVSMFRNGVSKDDVSGPVGIVTLVNETSQYGISSFLYLAALISLNLAIINLLPFPALDGGRIIFVIIRKITGNMITDKIEGYVHMVGMVLLLTLFLFITWNDISRLFS